MSAPVHLAIQKFKTMARKFSPGKPKIKQNRTEHGVEETEPSSGKPNVMATFRKTTQPPRLPGYRPLFRSPYALGGDGTRKEMNNKEAGPRVSLSDFLDRKLHKKSDNLPPRTVKGKLTPFSSPLGARGDAKSTGCCTATENNRFVFEQFKHSGIVEGCVSDSPGSSKTSAFTSSVELDPREEGTLKRRNPSEEGRRDEGRASHKPLLVLGDNPAPKRKEREENFTSWKKPRKGHYNHYGNGGGWWDSDREGVDAEEVGYGEIWEGVGSTTFGGIEWH